MTRKRLVVLLSISLVLAVTILAALTVFRAGNAPKFAATDITGVDWAADFKMTDHAGQPRTLADFRGKAVAVFFGYTHCPDVCPTALAQLSEAMRLLGEEAARVQVVFITVDPKRDTPEILSQYVPAFHPTFVGLRADAETTERTAKAFKVFYRLHEPDKHGAYSVDHSGSIFVFDPEGRLRLLTKAELGPAAIAHDLRTLLHEAS